MHRSEPDDRAWRADIGRDWSVMSVDESGVSGVSFQSEQQGFDFVEVTMKNFTPYGIAALVAAGCCTGLVVARGQSGTDSTEIHIEAARRAAGEDFTSVFDDLCGSLTPQPAAPSSPSPASPPPRSQWHVEPVKVFDNLYYLGQSAYTAWAVVTSDGIIVTDPLFDYSVEDEIVDGLRKLGLDPGSIKYVLISHGHRDHAGGAKLLQDRFGARVIMSEADWDLVAGNTQPWAKPKRDMVAVDGQRLTLGDTTVTLYLTPGHTPGTISMLVPVKDQGRSHIAAQWGGTGFNFTVTADRPRGFWYETYSRSADRFREIVANSGADVLIANHPNQDGARGKLAALANRRPGDRHPFVVGTDNVQRYLTMVGECAKAGLLSSGSR